MEKCRNIIGIFFVNTPQNETVRKMRAVFVSELSIIDAKRQCRRRGGSNLKAKPGVCRAEQAQEKADDYVTDKSCQRQKQNICV